MHRLPQLHSMRARTCSSKKTLALDQDELREIAEIAGRMPGSRLMVGFNRRFSPLAQKAREIFQPISGPLLINYRVNAGFLPRDHWTQTEQGGGRILGEVCHFVDLMQFLTGSVPVSVYALSVSADNAQIPDQDNVIISLRFENGSAGQITYLACGDKSLSKERVEIFGGGQTFIIDDFRVGEHYSGGSRHLLKLPRQRTSREQVEAFSGCGPQRRSDPSFQSLRKRSLLVTTKSTFAISRLPVHRAAASCFGHLR